MDGVSLAEDELNERWFQFAKVMINFESSIGKWLGQAYKEKAIINNIYIFSALAESENNQVCLYECLYLGY